MRIFDFFKSSAKPSTLHCTAVPEGRVNHEHHGEAPWETWVDRWTTTGHALWYWASENGYGSYDYGSSIRKYGSRTHREYISLQDAVNLLTDREIHVMREYRGFSSSLSIGTLRDYIDDHSFDRGHIFGYLQENPLALEKYLQQNQKDYKPRTQEQIDEDRLERETKRLLAAMVKQAGGNEALTEQLRKEGYTVHARFARVKKNIEKNKFPSHHAFAKLKKNPELFAAYAQRTFGVSMADLKTNLEIGAEINKLIAKRGTGAFMLPELQKYIADNNFSSRHIFGRIKADPTLLERFIAEAYPDYKAPAPVAPKPAINL